MKIKGWEDFIFGLEKFSERLSGAHTLEPPSPQQQYEFIGC
jgi:hypothetical protein